MYMRFNEWFFKRKKPATIVDPTISPQMQAKVNSDPTARVDYHMYTSFAREDAALARLNHIANAIQRVSTSFGNFYRLGQTHKLDQRFYQWTNYLQKELMELNTLWNKLGKSAINYIWNLKAQKVQEDSIFGDLTPNMANSIRELDDGMASLFQVVGPMSRQDSDTYKIASVIQKAVRICLSWNVFKQEMGSIFRTSYGIPRNMEKYAVD